MRTLFCLFFLNFFSFSPLFGQSGWVKIDSVRLVGLRKTRPATVLRELDFEKGDSLEVAFLLKKMDENRQRLLNTALFSEVKIGLFDGLQKGSKTVEITVSESFYLLPVPVLELADRNFNVWWNDHERSLRYLNFGFVVTHSNVTGRRDQLLVRSTWGYANRYEIGYSLPVFNRKKTLGAEVVGIWQRNREVGFRTDGNRLQLFFDPERRVFWRREARAALVWRPKLRWTHRLEASFFYRKAVDTIAGELNPNFFLQKRSKQAFAGLAAQTVFEGRDSRFYPLAGTFFSLELRKNGGPGGDLNTFSATAELGKWFKIGSKWSVEALVRGKKALLADSIPYHNYAAVGYFRDYLRGYEYYVVDGRSWAYLKTSVRREIFNRVIEQDPDLVPIKALQRLPFRAYLAINGDFGWVEDPFFALGNPLANRFLRGGGLGLDIVALNDKVFQIEASANHRGEIGLFFHLKTMF